MRRNIITLPLTILCCCIIIIASVACYLGISTHQGAGEYEYKSIRGTIVRIYGKGLYRHMSAQVAPQGIAQDYITLFLAVPLLLISFLLARKGSQKARIVFAGTLGYFLVTYLFFLVMGMYNEMFLGYVVLLGSSFYSFLLALQSFTVNNLPLSFHEKTPVKLIGTVLLFIAGSIALLWLSIVIPPLLDGTIIPVQVEHYTTLIVQGLDLALLLPAAFISGILFIKRRATGYLLTPIYFVFLSLLMSALTAKVIAMACLGYNVVPVIYIIPAFNVLSIVCTIVLLTKIKEGSS